MCIINDIELSTYVEGEIIQNDMLPDCTFIFIYNTIKTNVQCRKSQDYYYYIIMKYFYYEVTIYIVAKPN